MQRTQICLSKEQQVSLDALSESSGNSKSEMIRQAIDLFIRQKKKKKLHSKHSRVHSLFFPSMKRAEILYAANIDHEPLSEQQGLRQEVFRENLSTLIVEISDEKAPRIRRTGIRGFEHSLPDVAIDEKSETR